MAVTGTFRFHPVGQGLFYSGLINAAPAKRNGVFSFVYDCGSTSPRRFLYREIDDLKALLPRARSENVKRLDMLIVSHLHDDHVNGLEYLLNGVKVDTVVMPYTDSITRLLARAESLGEEEFLDAFYADPVGWFVSRGVRRILLIGSPPEGNYQAEWTNERSWRQEYGGISIDSGYIWGREGANETELLYLKNTVSATVDHFYWSFRFGNLKLSQEKSYTHIVDEFLKKLEKNRGEKKTVSLDEIFRNKHLTGELIEQLRPYILNSKTVNRTSVVVVHEPILINVEKTDFRLLSSSWLDGIPRSYNYFNDKMLSCYRKIITYCRKTILTGDIELSEDEMLPLEDVMYRYFAVFHYPHHGARGAIPNNKLPKHILTVFSAGITNRYGHPDSSVLWKNYCSFIVNERNAFDYCISIVE